MTKPRRMPTGDFVAGFDLLPGVRLTLHFLVLRVCSSHSKDFIINGLQGRDFPSARRATNQSSANRRKEASMRSGCPGLFLLGLVAVYVTDPIAAYAQSGNSAIAGTVRDGSDAVLPGVTV